MQFELPTCHIPPILGTCDYCSSADAEIVKSHSMWRKSKICKSCMADVQMVRPEDMLPAGNLLHNGYLLWLWRLCWELFDSRAFKVEFEDLPAETKENRIYDKRDWIASQNRFRSLCRVPARDWMPIRVEPKMVVQVGKDPRLDCSYFDGVHRLVYALMSGIDRIPAWFRPQKSPENLPPRIYQTLVLPSGFIPGERPPDRWKMIPSEAMQGKILDLAGNAGMHGILACVTNLNLKYRCLERDAEAVALGKCVAEMWGVKDRATFEACNVNEQKVEGKADCLWFLSCSKVVSYDTFMLAAESSGAKVFLFETHNLHDDPDSEKILALQWPWRFLGCTATIEGGPNVRRLWIADMRK